MLFGYTLKSVVSIEHRNSYIYESGLQALIIILGTNETFARSRRVILAHGDYHLLLFRDPRREIPANFSWLLMMI